MDSGLLLQGFGIGFAISVPVGPVGIMIMRRTLAEGLPSGAVAGVGSALGIALYGAVAGFGLTAISGLLLSQQRALKLVGGLLLVYLGFSIARAAPPGTELGPQSSARGPRLAGAFASTFVLTVVSPAVLVYFLALFANVGLVEGGRDYAGASALVGGVFAGSASWWIALSGTVSLLRSRLTVRWLRVANVVSGVGIAAFGAVILLQAAVR